MPKGKHAAKRELPRPKLRQVLFGLRNRLTHARYVAEKRKESRP